MVNRIMAIGREAMDLLFLEVTHGKSRYFVVIHKDSSIGDVKLSLTQLVGNRKTELYRPMISDPGRYLKQNDKTTLLTLGFTPECATSDRPGLLVLAVDDEEPDFASASDGNLASDLSEPYRSKRRNGNSVSQDLTEPAKKTVPLANRFTPFR